MLPTKQYFHLSALVPASKLHPIMQLLAHSSAYNVECRAYEPGKGDTGEPSKGKRRDMEAAKQKIIDLLAKKGPMSNKELSLEIGESPNKSRSLLARMVQAKLIKKGTKKGMYRS